MNTTHTEFTDIAEQHTIAAIAQVTGRIAMGARIDGDTELLMALASTLDLLQARRSV